MAVEYNLNINNFDITTYENNDEMKNQLKLIHKSWTTKNSRFSLVKYHKKFVSENNIDSVGLLRSVVFKENKILCFSPPKSLTYEAFTSKYKKENCVAQDFIEGTMINLFYDSTLNGTGDWELSTKSAVGANVGFSINHEKKFTHLEICFCLHVSQVKLDFENLSKDYCYSFVMQHPDNCIVNKMTEPKLYLIAAYKINNETNTVEELSTEMLHTIVQTSNATIEVPQEYEIPSFLTLKEQWASYTTPHSCQGIVVKNKKTGERTKLRNPSFEYVKKLRGNQAKLLFRYLQLRQSRSIKNYLEFYPQDKDAFNVFRDQIHAFTEQLHDYYLKVKIHKITMLNDIPEYFRTHVYKLHGKYLHELRPQNHTVQKHVVIDYVNMLPPPVLIKCLNQPILSKES